MSSQPSSSSLTVAADDHNHIFELMPPGYRFAPLELELIDYLKRKALNLSLPAHKILDVHVYKYTPLHLFGMGGNYDCLRLRRYFFSPRDRKYPNGSRPYRTVCAGGFWRITGKGKDIKNSKGEKVGVKNTLKFHLGTPKKFEKTNWLMHEYTLDEEPGEKKCRHRTKLDDWVLRVIYEKGSDNAGVSPANVAPVAEDGAAETGDPVVELHGQDELVLDNEDHAVETDEAFFQHLEQILDVDYLQPSHSMLLGDTSTTVMGDPQDDSVPDFHYLLGFEFDQSP